MVELHRSEQRLQDCVGGTQILGIMLTNPNYTSLHPK